MFKPWFDRLPGPIWLRALMVLALLAATAWVCHVFAFPLIDSLLYPDDVLQVGATDNSAVPE